MAILKAPSIDSNVQPRIWTNGLAHEQIKTMYLEAELREDVDQGRLQLWRQAGIGEEGFRQGQAIKQLPMKRVLTL